MQNIKFYEVKTAKGKWMGSYSPKLDSMKDRPTAFEQAVINAKHHGGVVHSVNEAGEDKLAWPFTQKGS